jgi:tetratricopeptide (TPR) repeat protein
MAGDESLRDVEQKLNASLAEADRRLPALLELPGGSLLEELEARPELRTVGMMQRLLDVARKALRRSPERAHELTSAVVACAPLLAPDAIDATIHRHLEAQAWKEHALVLHALGCAREARAAIAAARELFERDPGSAWYVATCDLVEAPILQELREYDEALALAQSAAMQFVAHRDHERYVDAGMVEIAILWEAGDRNAATEVWEKMAATARTRRDDTMTARISSKLALVELREGSVEEAARLFASAMATYDAAGYTAEAIDARRSFATALAARGRVHEAISELYKACAQLLASGALLGAALVSTDILERLLAAGRLSEIGRFTETLAVTFAEAGMPPHVLKAMEYLHAAAARGTLDYEEIVAARDYFEDLRQQPNATFTPPEEGEPRV